MSNPVWVYSGPLTAGARRLEGRYSQSTARPGTVWLDVNALGTHLPQMYPHGDIHELTRDACAGLGLCDTCYGFGDLGATSSPFARHIDEVGNPCPSCAGSGRSALRVLVKRDGSGISADIRPLPHGYVPTADPELAQAYQAAPDMCQACGFRPDDTGPQGNRLHPEPV